MHSREVHMFDSMHCRVILHNHIMSCETPCGPLCGPSAPALTGVPASDPPGAPSPTNKPPNPLAPAARPALKLDTLPTPLWLPPAAALNDCWREPGTTPLGPALAKPPAPKPPVGVLPPVHERSKPSAAAARSSKSPAPAAAEGSKAGSHHGGECRSCYAIVPAAWGQRLAMLTWPCGWERHAVNRQARPTTSHHNHHRPHPHLHTTFTTPAAELDVILAG